MSQYDASAMPMWRCFQSTPDLTGFTANPLQWDIGEKNVQRMHGSERVKNLTLQKKIAFPTRNLQK